jgi:hypothetical protein
VHKPIFLKSVAIESAENTKAVGHDGEGYLTLMTSERLYEIWIRSPTFTPATFRTSATLKLLRTLLVSHSLAEP